MIRGKKISGFWLLAVALLLCTITYAQNKKWFTYKVVNSVVYIQYERNVEQAKQDSLLGTCGINQQQLEDMYRQGTRSIDGWQVTKLNSQNVTLSKPLKSFKGFAKDQRNLVFELAPPPPPTFETQYYFGYNNFKKACVVELENGLTRFYLKVTGQPQSVYLSGTFNEWSTLSLPMFKTDSGYVADVKLAAGGHLYKFIIDGHWVLDPRNKRIETTWEGIENSVYFKTNHTFKLLGYPDAKKVKIAGSFNNWEPNITLEKTNSGWKKSVFIKEGTHAYKFVIDGKWILDPGNPITRSDGMGNENSFFAVGDSFYFYLPQNLSAKEVRVAGSFNGWNEAELYLSKTDSGWVLPYVLAAGNYPYKFIVDGSWTLDPTNLITENSTGYTNSLLVIKPNISFRIKQYPNAQKIIVAGDYNNWEEQGAAMYFKNNAWQIDLHFPSGKNRYKFIVDGQWVLDPNNTTYEDNEYDGANSVVWIP